MLPIALTTEPQPNMVVPSSRPPYPQMADMTEAIPRFFSSLQMSKTEADITELTMMAGSSDRGHVAFGDRVQEDPLLSQWGDEQEDDEIHGCGSQGMVNIEEDEAVDDIDNSPKEQTEDFEEEEVDEEEDLEVEEVDDEDDLDLEVEEEAVDDEEDSSDNSEGSDDDSNPNA